MTFDEPLVKAPVVYHLDFPENKNMSFPRFLELFYFARRRNFGKATVDTLEGASNSARRGEASAIAMLSE